LRPVSGRFQNRQDLISFWYKQLAVHSLAQVTLFVRRGVILPAVPLVNVEIPDTVAEGLLKLVNTAVLQ
jgi:hypothetical protein